MQRRCNGGVTEVQRRCNGGALYLIRAARGKVWLMGAVISGYEAGRSLRTSESRGGFRSSAENHGQAGGLTYGAGTVAVI